MKKLLFLSLLLLGTFTIKPGGTITIPGVYFPIPGAKNPCPVNSGSPSATPSIVQPGGGKTVSTTTNCTCNSGYYPTGQTCSQANPSCPNSSYTLSNGTCNGGTPTCPSPTSLSGGSCIN